jgi:hypothetical protein
MKSEDKRILEKYSRMFEVLAEYDRTGRLPRIRYKERINITIDAGLLKKLKKYCRTHGFKVSSFIEKSVKESIAS